MHDPNLEFILIDCAGDADLIREQKTGKYCWHRYGEDIAPEDESFSQDFDSEDEAREAWRTGTVKF